MSLPTPAKTYTFTVNQTVTYTSVSQVTREVIFGYKNALKAAGFTVKGSSTGAAAAMDGSDRWTAYTDIGTRGANTTSAQAWIVLEHATGMGGTEIMLAWQGASDDMFKVSISQSGAWTVAATATHQPTAVDELIIRANTLSWDSTASGDRVWHFAISTDASVHWLMVARGGAFRSFLYIGLCNPAVVAPAVWTVPVWGLSKAASSTLDSTTLLQANQGIKVRPNGSDYSANACFATETGTVGNGGMFGASGCPDVWELQGGIYVFGALAIHCTTKGKAGNVYDMWLHGTTPVDGDTWPAGTDRTHISIGDFALPWDGSVPVMT